MDITTLGVHGFKYCVNGQRGPYKSYAKCDTDMTQPDGQDFVIGDADYKMMKTLCKAGPNHRKWMRQVFVWADINAPRDWWSEFDTHVIGVSKNSESTMHTLSRDNIGYDMVDLSWDEDVSDVTVPDSVYRAYGAVFKAMIELQGMYADATSTEEKNDIRHMIKGLLPESFLQRRCVCMSYEAIRHMYDERHNHRLPEWREIFCKWVETLPYSEFLTGNFNE